MKTFSCHCGNILHFENSACLTCGRMAGFLPDVMRMAGLDAAGEDTWRQPAGAQLYRRCRNYRDHDVCNWLVPAGAADDYCPSCRLNLLIPDLGERHNLTLWYRVESAKRRLLYTLFSLRLPIVDRARDPVAGLGFEFVAAAAADGFSSHLLSRGKALTGHRSGIITINIREAEDSAREKMREKMNERYRTLLGHFRHEIGHYYWDRLISGGQRLADFRRLFGDERRDYAQALGVYYGDGPPAGWERCWISAYASAHPWEDWAETWAHYLHMVDTLETARDSGFTVEGRRIAVPSDGAFDTLVADWEVLTVALNALNRSMGLPDAYPFALTEATGEKLAFVHAAVQSVVAR